MNSKISLASWAWEDNKASHLKYPPEWLQTGEHIYWIIYPAYFPESKRFHQEVKEKNIILHIKSQKNRFRFVVSIEDSLDDLEHELIFDSIEWQYFLYKRIHKDSKSKYLYWVLQIEAVTGYTTTPLRSHHIDTVVWNTRDAAQVVFWDTEPGNDLELL